MKKIFIVCALAAMLCGCGDRVIEGHTYSPYGLFNETSMKNPNIQYEISAASVVIGVIFIETAIVPLYIIGWDLFEPVSTKSPKDPSEIGLVK